MGETLVQLVEKLTESCRKGCEAYGTDINIVCVLGDTVNNTMETITCSGWRTANGLTMRTKELRDKLKESTFDNLCITGPHGSHGEIEFFIYAEDKNGCWFSLLPLDLSNPTRPTFGQPDFRPANESDGFYNLLPNALS